MSLILENLPLFFIGLKSTLLLAAVTLAAATLIGVFFGTLGSLKPRWLRALVALYVETFRDIPLIVTIFAIFFGAPFLGMPLEPFPAVALGLSLWGGANAAEIVRGGIASVASGQAEAATALGLRLWQIYLLVLWPQALRAVLPAYTGLLALIIQSTSLGALVGVTEFLKAGGLVIERSTVMLGINPAFEIYSFVLLVYFLLCSILTTLSRRLERRLASSGQRPVAARDALQL
ncbi:amino acid ABC transporter permease [Belnapia sp. T6]|uniref:Amino acid ABC transporter permease n=1 Tax=Belnapia mucosa TaxID=2804532 RepID=A0ABS1V4D2_9PROT|nr:amino acid ABC transporter permease [Belnapia mucosa]MBL6456555.1 amino acid ABC transporter permease [Belnapia mucosa]